MIDLLAELRSVISSLDIAGIPYALCGGLAMAVHGVPKATVDIDLLVLRDDLARLEVAVLPLGFDLDAHPRRFRGGAIEIRRLSKLHPSEHPLSLDLLLVTPTVQAVWDDRQSMEWDFGKVSVVSLAGLIALKSLRGSGPDQDDIRRLQGENE
jgi:hypothetical protein